MTDWGTLFTTDLRSFRLTDMIETAARIRRSGTEPATLDETATRIVRFLHDAFVSSDGRRQCALVRCFRTQALGQLPPDLRARATDELLAEHGVDGASAEDTRCLTLIATAGVEPAWNDPAASKNHRVIPLPSREVVARSPMIAQLISQLGLDVATVLRPEPGLLVDLHQRSYNVFHVEDAAGSPAVPAQSTFVEPYGISSVVGFGGILPGGDLFSIILFSTVRVSRESADLFKTLAVATKLALLSAHERAAVP